MRFDKVAGQRIMHAKKPSGDITARRCIWCMQVDFSPAESAQSPKHRAGEYTGPIPAAMVVFLMEVKN